MPLRVDLSADGRVLRGRDAEKLPLLLKSDAVDSLQVTLVPSVIGGNTKAGLSGSSTGFLPKDLEFRLEEVSEKNGVLNLLYVRRRTPSRLIKKKRKAA